MRSSMGNIGQGKCTTDSTVSHQFSNELDEYYHQAANTGDFFSGGKFKTVVKRCGKPVSFSPFYIQNNYALLEVAF